ncbi:MAG: lipoprotein-releasing ABC transporter permease subunit, partial [Sphingomonadales bacterium]
WSVALRYLRARRSDKFISVIAGFSLGGISLGVMVLIVVMSVMNGFRVELLGRVLGVNGHVMVYGYDGELREYDALTAEIRAVDGVVRAYPLIEGQVMATNQNEASGAVLRGVTEASLVENEYVGPNIIEGSLDGFDEGRKIAVGVQMARRLNVQVGETLTLISPQGTATPFGTAPRIMAYEVTAIFEVGVFDYDNAFVFMPLEEAQIYFKLRDAVKAIEVFVENPDEVDGISGAIMTIAGNNGYVGDWRSMNQSLFTALQVERNVMFIILTLIILIAAFNIISSMIILVKDKSKDVAILRTMGASGKSLMKIFVIAGGSIGFIGTLLGLGLGVLITENIQPIQRFIQSFSDVNLWSPEVRFLTEMPAQMKASEIITIVLISFLISFLATLPPARRAAKLDPVEILRNEG